MSRPEYRLHHVRRIASGSFVLRFDRHGLAFEPGQHVALGIPGSIARRDYSIYSGVNDDYLEVLIREVPGGLVSPALGSLRPGDVISVEGPHGFFVTDPGQRAVSRYLFVATGVGVAPFRSFARSYSGMQYLLLHGVRTLQDRCMDPSLVPAACLVCVSRGEGGDHHGRVTDYLREHPVKPDQLCYLCGNGGMIDDVSALLKGQGIPRHRMFAEVYF